MVDPRPEAEMSVAPPSLPPTNDLTDDDEIECRVCRGEAEPDRRLYAPCKCSGSIRFTHSDCLEQWLEHSGKIFCELCGHKFTFTPLYNANAPDVLPWTELLTTGLRVVLLKWLPFAVRATLVVFLWLAVAPWCTSWLYRMWLLRASAMINVNFSERFDASHIVSDIFAGVILIVCIVFSFLALMSFADFLRFHLDHIEEDMAADNVPHHHHHAHRHDVVQHARRPPLEDNNHVANVIENEQVAPVMVAPRQLDDVNDAESDDSSDEGEWADPNHVEPIADALMQHQEIALMPRAEDADPVLPPQNELRQRRPLREIEDERVRQAVIPPRAARQRMDPPPNMNQREWEDDFEHMEINIAMDELLGLRGDLIVLFRNVSWLLAFNGAYLGLFAFIPYTLGSTLLSAGARILVSLPVSTTAYSALIKLESATEQDLNLGGYFVKMLLQAIETAKEQGDCLQLVDICTCTMGYLSICLTIVLWRFMVRTASSYIHRPLMEGLLWALRCLTAIVKVSTLLLLKMVILPILLGLCIDFATLHMFMVSAQDRISFCLQNMICALMVHWVLGITFMLFVTVSVLLMREVAHPEVLAKLIRPQEDHPDLLRTLLSESCITHARRMILSLVIYAALLLVLVHIPVRIASALAPSYFPLTLHFQHLSSEIQVPLELLMVHLVVLSVLEHAKNDIGKLQHIAIVFASKWLGLTDYLLPQTTVEIDLNGQRQSKVVILPPPPLHFHPRAQLLPEELRVQGHRYLPWPEDGVDNPQLLEYPLLSRKRPSHLWLRLAGLAIFTWAVCVVVIGTFLFGSFFTGRICMGPFERVSGISHDPLVMAAGVQIVWFLVNSAHTLKILMLPEIHVDPILVERGYTVRNRSLGNSIACVVGWAFVCPILLGLLMSSCMVSANATWLESFLMGYLLLNLFVWLVCCFRSKQANRRRNRRQVAPEAFEADANDFLDVDNEDELFDDDPQNDELELEDERPRPEEGAVVVVADSVGIIASIQKVHRQLHFNLTVHDNVAVRLRRENIRLKCFDVNFFRQNVLQPIMLFLVGMLVVPWIMAFLVLLTFSSVAENFEKALFAICAFWVCTVFVLVRSRSLVTRWLSNLSESIRNERYLIGRQLQDMTR
ncbi:e3 ubiquitin-protein ligase march6 (membrane-associated ring finger protein 6) [Plasmopara halstedii]|uniref:RING-type E3 ubiquitin transferase n=1 Tax=Plasmopara halstedii TaxID=4781 RepID=A0A0P1AST3_PLAHL|nr:e3 ubiquitin-protein ligase march6 (membrane-associated ring finger protein 6) [Plasmopara halstedii]CEG44257.1 e3 ubiquitin-protein ligase march6 (membrane-associated ring finger protein 6) [Plasmopara halstedii]|eukprot:XP_024580626.1 e3 ubiquitin-protein ligase march6 (membrane-associated ring finger protein 6) [Plasmopara halstedii]